jgi:hypothetical protein
MILLNFNKIKMSLHARCCDKNDESALKYFVVK